MTLVFHRHKFKISVLPILKIIQCLLCYLTTYFVLFAAQIMRINIGDSSQSNKETMTTERKFFKFPKRRTFLFLCHIYLCVYNFLIFFY